MWYAYAKSDSANFRVKYLRSAASSSDALGRPIFPPATRDCETCFRRRNLRKSRFNEIREPPRLFLRSAASRCLAVDSITFVSRRYARRPAIITVTRKAASDTWEAAKKTRPVNANKQAIMSNREAGSSILLLRLRRSAPVSRNHK